MDNFNNHYVNNHIFNYISFILVLYRRYINLCIYVCPHVLAPSYATVYIYIYFDDPVKYVLRILCMNLIKF